MARRQVLRSIASVAVAIVLGIAVWGMTDHADDQADPPLQIINPSTTSSTEAEASNRVLADQAVVINVDELEECNVFHREIPNANLPAWAHDAKLIAGRWLVVERAIALPLVDPERPQLSVLWHFETPPSDPTDFSASATTASGEEIEAIVMRSSAPGFFRSTFPLDERGCWSIRAHWGEEEAEIRFLVDVFSGQ